MLSSIINVFAIDSIGTRGSFLIAVGINCVELVIYVIYTSIDLSQGITDNYYKFREP